MLVAHPDDDAIFGFHDLLNNNCTVICFTHGETPRRREEFFRCMDVVNAKGHMMNFPDNKRSRWEDTTNLMVWKTIRPWLKGKFDAIVSHDSEGEYGHKHHRRIHHIAKFVSSRLGIPFYDFRSRFHESDYGDRHDAILNIYATQHGAVLDFKYFFSSCGRGSKEIPPSGGKTHCPEIPVGE